MKLTWVLATLTCIYKVATAYEQHCIDPANCQFYPIHGCYATEIGLVCKNRNKGGFEMSIDPLYTFLYTPITAKNDTGMPCFSIPITDELINYVDFRGPQVIDYHDLTLMGNCSSMSYCDAVTRTCQPKLPLGSRCQYNMQCYFGIDGIPGVCTNHTCSIRQDIPQYYYNTPQLSMGDQWKAAIIAVVVTGAIATALLVGRLQIKKLVAYGKGVMERWQNRDSIPINNYAVNEQVWNEHHNQQQRWWKQVPGVDWIYKKFRKQDEYYQLNNRGDDEPPPYRPDEN